PAVPGQADGHGRKNRGEAMRLGQVIVPALVALSSCGTRGKAGSAAPTAPLSSAVSQVGGDGRVDGRGQGARAWTVRGPGQHAENVAALRTQAGGAVLDLGNGRGRLWLKDDTSIDLGTDAAGDVRVVVATGEARLRQGTRDILFFSKEG